MNASNPTPTSHVSRVVVSRLFSMGQYEHQRVEVTVDIQPGARPGQIVGQLSKAIEVLKPRTTEQEFWLQECRATIAGEQAGIDAGAGVSVEHAKRVVADAEVVEARRQAALREIDEMGGVIS